jgi:putative Holliday junction resolvase
LKRALGIDVGERRVGLAVSDASRTLARPLRTLAVSSLDNAVDLVLAAIDQLASQDEGLSTIIVGMPVRLDGTPNEATGLVSAFIDALRERTAIPISTEDERLTSREAESRLAVRERDWRKRKQKLDAAAAAIIRQYYLARSAG